MKVNKLLIFGFFSFLFGVFFVQIKELHPIFLYSCLLTVLAFYLFVLNNIKRKKKNYGKILRSTSHLYYTILGSLFFSLSEKKKADIDFFKEKKIFIATCSSDLKETKKAKVLNSEITHLLNENIYSPIASTSCKIILPKNFPKELYKGDKIFFEKKINEVNIKKASPIFKNLAKANQVYYSVFLNEKDVKIFFKHSTSNFHNFSFLFHIKKFLETSLVEKIKNKKILSIVISLVLGNKNYMLEEVQENYSKTGTIHVLAVSGLHVGVFYLLVQYFLKFFFFFLSDFHFIKEICSLIFLWLFAIISGFSPSVVRATTMFSIISLGKIFKKKVTIYDSLAISSFIILFYNPRMIFDIGFQLSYSAVLGIAMFNSRFKNIFSIQNKFLNKIWAMISISLSAQLGTFPLTSYYFFVFPTYFLIGNILIVPLACFVLYGGIFTITFSKVPFLGTAFAYGTSLIASFMNWFTSFLSGLPYHAIFLPMNFYEVICLYFIIISFYFFVNTKKFSWLMTFLFCVCSAAIYIAI